ncbi:transcription initiation factor TFIID subunit 7, putative [Plasmodium berghei]|uniref:Transcription initiation factor TFIID subunit 7, putative n=2 Tax=Plasmodium berghei TaxID=5821 RepID=A0A509AKV9_PLABA|nr:transcription initiation factor TFIID subunit 7, putative [Plasmodium berghei ANKA]CXI35843.1 transcription initiation factor TFIID subunit 7, putative [Plasmodium berghei]SCM21540.1 transcription initiation factor TFIID subunit 7, putative [Plasmodium berghei]SCN24741.1 transcription initiation factor TFIID subunit 7, putative [Plasmodium berghei]SCO59878.1 transcription initiation factor TFIID subunit 7, putative [Plasmodium berghei]SCO61200.1 transcription initiation factor TFIID subunit|eukprot:XP_034421271.1 transcription initiation factor TFIID subunit 7, putative [Plasmodium berghei ANKA]
MEKKERDIKISLNINANIKVDYFDENLPEGIDSELKPNSKDVLQAIRLIENIRNGTFNYKNLQEVYFMNDTDLLKIINEAKTEEKFKSTQNKSPIQNNDVIEEINVNNNYGDDNREVIENNKNGNEYINNGIKNGKIFMMDNSQVGKVCIIRFPPKVSIMIKKHLIEKDLDLEIKPTNLLNSRFFIINFKNINKKYYGILLELSTHIEIHKTLDRNNLYKTNDVSQIIYVYDPQDKKNKKLIKKMINNNFQLNSGISNKVNNFNFQNWAKLYKYHDIYFAEKLLNDYLNANFYDYYDIYVKTYNEMYNHIEIEQGNCNKQNDIVDEGTDISKILSSLDNTYNIMNKIEKDNSDINLETLLNYDINHDNYESDVSDLLLGGNYYLRKKK